MPRGTLGVRAPEHKPEGVRVPSDLNLNQGVRVPWTVPITRLIKFTLNESMGMKVRPLGALQPLNHKIFIAIIFNK